MIQTTKAGYWIRVLVAWLGFGLFAIKQRVVMKVGWREGAAVGNNNDIKRR